MRVGLVSPYSFSHPGGVQNHILGLAGWLAGQGHDPRILAPGPVPQTALAERGLAASDFTSLGRAVPVAWNGSVARINGGPVSGLRVRRWLRRERLDVLHLHEPITPSGALWALGSWEGPLVATFHLATPHSPLLASAGRVLRPWIARIDEPIAVSPTAAAVVRDHLGREPAVVPNGFEPQRFRPPAAVTEPPTRSTPGARGRVVFAGRVAEPRKGLPVFLAAVDRIRAAVPEVEFVVAGPGRVELPAGVRRLGALSDGELIALLRSATVFVAPHTGRESFGLVLLEALAAGATVVASDLPAFTEVLTTTDGNMLGRTFPTGDGAALADTVLAALSAPPGDPAYVGAHLRRYAWESVGPRILTHYHRAMVS